MTDTLMILVNTAHVRSICTYNRLRSITPFWSATFFLFSPIILEDLLCIKLHFPVDFILNLIFTCCATKEQLCEKVALLVWYLLFSIAPGEDFLWLHIYAEIRSWGLWQNNTFNSHALGLEEVMTCQCDEDENTDQSLIILLLPEDIHAQKLCCSSQNVCKDTSCTLEM